MFDVSHKIQVDLAILLADYSCFFLELWESRGPQHHEPFHCGDLHCSSWQQNKHYISKFKRETWEFILPSDFVSLLWKGKLEGMWLLFGSFFMFSKVYRLDVHNDICAILGDLRWSIHKIRIENWTSPYLVNYVIGSACFLIPKSNAWVISICGCYGV